MKASVGVPLCLLLILHTFRIVHMKETADDSCELDEHHESVVQWYSRVSNFINANQNVSEQIAKLSQRVEELEQKLAEAKKSQNSLSIDTPNEIVIQRRQDGSEDFYRSWDEYKRGFGNPAGEFFIGLDRLHELTNSRPYSLLVVMMDWENQRRYALYDRFIVGSEASKYKLESLGTFSGSAGDSLAGHLGHKFTTKDQKNDAHSKNCAEQFKGAWWYGACHVSNLNGLYLKGPIGGEQWAQGVVWKTFKDYTYSLKFVEMILIRT